jgi:hypothetical protein
MTAMAQNQAEQCIGKPNNSPYALALIEQWVYAYYFER